MKFFERLYLGFEAEHFVAGKFFANGHEAFRMPGDFGFDLLITDQRERVEEKTSDNTRQPLPYAIQVKSRRMSISEFKENTSTTRLEANTCFQIKVEDINLLVETENSFLVFVVFINDKSKLFNDRVLTVWFNSQHVKMLHDLGYFVVNPDKPNSRIMNVGIRLLPEVDSSTYLQSLVDKKAIDPVAKDELLKMIPPRIRKNWRASEYVALLRPSRAEGDISLCQRMLNDALLDLANIGHNHNLGSID